MTAVNQAVKLVRASKRAYSRKWAFAAVAFLVFLFTILMLGRLDLLPNAPKAAADVVTPSVTLDASPSVVATTSEAVMAVEVPVKIEIANIGLSTSVSNPLTTDINVLNNALTKGAVRYPTSAKLGEEGNMILFGHSSYLPIIHNAAYKAFDNIQKLKVGDRITVSSASTAYIYAVSSVEKRSAAADDGIALTSTGHTLTLSTCNLFGAAKTDRFVVTAQLVESYPLAP